MTATASAERDRVRIAWPDGRTDAYPYIWLRDNCRCAECFDPDTWERQLDTVAVPPDIAPHTVEVDRGLTVEWEDGHRTALSEAWLREHAPGRRGDVGPTPAPAGWDASISSAPPEISFSEIDSGEDGVRRWLRLIRDHGFALVRGVPPEPEAVVGLAERIAFVQASNFGRSFDVVSKPDPENLAYTAHALSSHTDIPNRHSAVNLQLLHCLENTANGGDSVLVDGFEAVRRLAATDPDAFDLLRSVTVPWRYQDDSIEITNRYPVIGTDDAGRVVEVRFHTALMAPLDLDADHIPAFYAALRAFGRIVRDPDLAYRFRMEPGDCQVFDNQRVLHGRTAFDPSSGHRHLQGCYLDKDDALGRLRALENGNGDYRTC